MFAESKDEIALILVGSEDTENPLADGECYEHVSIVNPLGVVDFDLLQYVQNDVKPSTVSGDCILCKVFENAVFVLSGHLNTFHRARDKVCICFSIMPISLNQILCLTTC